TLIGPGVGAAPGSKVTVALPLGLTATEPAGGLNCVEPTTVTSWLPVMGVVTRFGPTVCDRAASDASKTEASAVKTKHTCAHLGVRRRQHEAIGQGAIAGELGDLAAACAGEQQEADDVAERVFARTPAVLTSAIAPQRVSAPRIFPPTTSTSLKSSCCGNSKVSTSLVSTSNKKQSKHLQC